MGRHDHLADARLVHAPQEFEKLDLPRWRQCRLGFIENVKALPTATLQRNAGSPRRANATKNQVEGRSTAQALIHRDSERPKRSSPPGRTSHRDLRQPACPQRLRQPAAHHLTGARMIDRPITFAAACLVETRKSRNSFQEGRLPGPVFAHDDRDCFVELSSNSDWKSGRQNGYAAGSVTRAVTSQVRRRYGAGMLTARFFAMPVSSSIGRSAATHTRRVDAPAPHRPRILSAVYVTHSLPLPPRRASVMIRPAEDL